MLSVTEQKFVDAWINAGGFYSCPKDIDGRRHGPLVAYSGEYEPGKHWVGDGYYNFAKIEEHRDRKIIERFAADLAVRIQEQFGDTRIDWVAGMAMGGLFLAGKLADQLNCQSVFIEKKITRLATSDSREQFEMVMKRHEIEVGSNGVIVEDVTNNFSATEKAQVVIHKKRANLLTVATAMNRSEVTTFKGALGDLPVVSVIHIPTPEYRQDDPAVAEDVKAGNIVWKPKEHWDQLMTAMNNYAAVDETGC